MFTKTQIHRYMIHWYLIIFLSHFCFGKTTRMSTLDDGSKPRITLSTCRSACASCSAWEWTLIEMTQSTDSENHDLSAFSCSAAVSACASMMKWEQTLCQFRLAKRLAVLSQQLFSATMLACGTHRHWPWSFHLLSSWRQDSTDSDFGRISLESFNALFQICYESSQWTNSLQLLITMSQLRQVPDVSGLSSLTRLLGVEGIWRTSLQIELNQQLWSYNVWSCEVATAPATLMLSRWLKSWKLVKHSETCLDLVLYLYCI